MHAPSPSAALNHSQRMSSHRSTGLRRLAAIDEIIIAATCLSAIYLAHIHRHPRVAMSTRRTRGSAPAAQEGQLPAEPPPVSINELKGMVELLVKSAARQHGIATAESPFDDIRAQLEAALEEEEAEDNGDDADHGDSEEQQARTRSGHSGADGGSGATSSTARAMSSTGAVPDAVMDKLDEMQRQCSGSKHDYGFAGNPSTMCGVCSSQWEEGCGWKPGKGNWACFTCQVYICNWECLNNHNTGNHPGNTVRGSTVIYTKQQVADGEMAAAQEGKKRRK